MLVFIQVKVQRAAKVQGKITLFIAADTQL